MSGETRLPQGWTVAKLSQCALRITDGTHLPPTFVDSGVPFLFVKHIVKGILTFDDTKFISAQTWQHYQSRCPVELGDVLYTAVGSYGVAVSVKTDRPFSFQRHIAHIKPYSKCDSQYLSYFLNSPFGLGQAHRVARGVAQKTVTLGDLKDFYVNLAPFNEQLRIVAKIEELFSDLDAGVAALQRAKANLKRYRAAVLKAAVEGKLTEEWRAQHPAEEPASALLARILKERRLRWEAEQVARAEVAERELPKNWTNRYVEPPQPTTTQLPQLPDDWTWVTLGQLLYGIEGGKSFKCLTRPANDDEWGVIKVSAMTWGTFLEEEQKAIPPGSQFDPDDEVRPNDLLLSRSNTTELVGATVLVEQCRRRLLLSDKSLRLKVSHFVDKRWLHKALSSSIVRKQLSAMATGTSDSMRNVSQEKIESVAIPLPPRDEQTVIVSVIEERLSNAALAESTVHLNQLRASRLRQSILKRAFEGKLVPQDPNDEPASVLLDRLRSQSLQTTRPATAVKLKNRDKGTKAAPKQEAKQ